MSGPTSQPSTPRLQLDIKLSKSGILPQPSRFKAQKNRSLQRILLQPVIQP